MAKLYISEFTSGRAWIGTFQVDAPPQPNVVDQTVAIGAGSVQSNPFNALTRYVLVAADAVCSIAFGAPAAGANPGVVATAANFRLNQNAPPIGFAVQPGQCVAAITNV